MDTVAMGNSLEECERCWRSLWFQSNFLLLTIEDTCVNMQVEMIHKEKHLQDVGNRGDNWKSNAFEKGRNSGIQETDQVRHKYKQGQSHHLKRKTDFRKENSS